MERTDPDPDPETLVPWFLAAIDGFLSRAVPCSRSDLYCRTGERELELMLSVFLVVSCLHSLDLYLCSTPSPPYSVGIYTEHGNLPSIPPSQHRRNAVRQPKQRTQTNWGVVWTSVSILRGGPNSSRR